MKTVIIGSGNVAFHLAKAFSEAKIPVEAIYSRNQAAAEEISQLTAIPHAKDLPEAELYIIAVSDSAVAEVSSSITKKDCIVAHTSGSLPLEILNGVYRKACFYPLQTFSKSKNLNYAEIPFFIETENHEDQIVLENLARQISDKVMATDFTKRKYIHLTAVYTCNFVNHLFAKGKEISDSQNIPFDYFLPLIKETVEKIYYLEPKAAQTGPAVRNDQRVLGAHKALLNDPDLLNIYETINRSILNMYHPE